MAIALRPLATLLRRGLQKEATQEISKQIIQQTQNWRIDPLLDIEQVDEEGQEPTRETGGTAISSEAVARFFTWVFDEYRFAGWTVLQDPGADHAHISLSRQQLVLPNKTMDVTTVRELLAHEIEIHAFRSVSGKQSRLTLLSSGLQGYLETEEGLATYYTQEVARYTAAGNAQKTWIGTLATGLAAGIISEPLTFHQLQRLLEMVNTLRSLLTAKDPNLGEIQKKALKNAQSRCLRTFRGVADLSQPGVCSTKDNSYLRGYLAVTQALNDDPTAFNQLMVGSIGLHHLRDMAELGITSPNAMHKQLAIQPDLERYITQFERRA